MHVGYITPIHMLRPPSRLQPLELGRPTGVEPRSPDGRLSCALGSARWVVIAMSGNRLETNVELSANTKRGRYDELVAQAPAPCTLSVDVLPGIGGVRARRLARDLDIHTVRQVWRSSVDELTEIWSIAELTAGRVLGRAQALVNAYEDAKTDMSEIIPAQKDTPDGYVGRLGIVFGSIDERGELPDELDINDVRATIDEALDEFDLTITEDTQVGFQAASWNRDFGFSGGSVVRSWLDKKQSQGLCFTPEVTFDVDFGLYKLWMDPFDVFYGDDGADSAADVAEARMELKAERTENGRRTDMHEIPDRYDVQRPGDANLAMAIDERDRKIAQWADVVIMPIVGEYAEQAIDRMSDTATVHAYKTVSRTGRLVEYDPVTVSRSQTPDISLEDTVSNRNFAVECPHCGSNVYLDGPKKSSRCMTCYREDGELNMISTSNAAEVIGEVDVTPEFRDDISNSALQMLNDDMVELGPGEYDEEFWSPDGESSTTGGHGVGSNRHKFG